MSTQITISPEIKLVVNTTPITGGSAGQILFQTTGNTVGESANLFWDNTNGRLGIGTSSPSAIIHSVGSVTASGAIARSNYLNNTLVASANSDILVGLDIQPTFTNGAFTGVDNFSLRINGGKGVIGTTANTGVFPLIVRQSNYSGLLVQNSFTGTNHNSSYDGFAFWTNNDGAFAKSLITNWDNNGIYIYNSGISPTGLVLFGATNNLGLNTTTDAGFKLDVNGTARVSGNTTFGSSTNQPITFTHINDSYSQIDFTDSVNARSAFIRGARNAQYLTIGFPSSTSNVNFSPTIVNIGVSKDAPLPLQVNGTPVASITDSAQLRVSGSTNTTNTGSKLAFFCGADNSTNATDSAGIVVLKTNTFGSGTNSRMLFYNMQGTTLTERMRIADSGNVLINTTTDAGFRLDVNGTARFSGNVELPTTSLILQAGISGFAGSGNVLLGNNFNIRAMNSSNTGTMNLIKSTSGNNIEVGGANHGNTFINPTLNSGQTVVVGDNVVVASAVLNVSSTTKGFLPPRMTQTQRNAIASPAIGLEIYQTDATEGKYIYKSSGWTYIG